MIVNLIKNYYDLYIVKFIVTNLTLFNKKSLIIIEQGLKIYLD